MRAGCYVFVFVLWPLFRSFHPIVTIVRPEHGFLLYQHCKVNDYYVFKPIRRISLEIDVVRVSSLRLGISSRSVRPFDFSHEAEKVGEFSQPATLTHPGLQGGFA